MVSGTPIQNDLLEFHSLLDFCIPNCLGSVDAFRKAYANPIMKMRDAHATEKELARGAEANDAFTAMTNTIRRRRGARRASKRRCPRPR